MTLYAGFAVHPFSEVAPVALPTQGQLFPTSGRATVSGWGTLRSGGVIPDELHAVEVRQ